MRVLHVIPSLALAHGGPSRAMRLIERAMREQGLDSETATTDDNGLGGRDERPLGISLLEDGACRRYFRKTVDPYKVSLAFARWIGRHAGDYDLIHIHALFSFTSTIAALAARRASVPYVIRPLGTLAAYGMAQRRPGLKRLSMTLLERRILRDAAAVHFTSEMEQREAATLGLEFNGAIIPLAAVLEGDAASGETALLERFRALRNRSYVLFLSRLDPKKNVEGLLESIRLCSSELPDTCLLIAGGGASNYVEELQTRADRLGIGERVIWAGHLEGDMKAAAFAGAELFVLPSYSENFGIAAAEALVAGLPVVLGKGVALSSIAVSLGAGVVVEPEPEAIAKALRSYLLDPESRARASANAKSLAAREFSLEMMGARLVDLYENILAASDRKWPGEQVDA